MKDLAVVLMSGGLDSCVTAAIARQNYDLACLHVSYGQKTQGRERQAFDALCAHFQVPQRLAISLEHLKLIGGSQLLEGGDPVEEGNLQRSEMPRTYVPFRNAHLLSIGVSWGEVLGAKALFIGVVQEDGSGYPDCRATFIHAFQQVIHLGTRPDTDLTLHTPLIQMSKAQIVKKGVELQAPLHLSWSCYREQTLACGQCDSCLLRLRGFAQSGHVDPIPYGHQTGKEPHDY
jgi:7-cyano-7-deazaguanine synthase